MTNDRETGSSNHGSGGSYGGGEEGACGGEPQCEILVRGQGVQAKPAAASARQGPPQQRRGLQFGMHKTISFEAIAPGLLVRTTDDGHLLALDFLSTLSNGDRKKASQILARIATRPETSSLLTLRRVACKPKPRKLISFSNAIQMLLVLPKRTVGMETRRAVTGVLTDHYEYRHQHQQQEAALASRSQTAPPGCGSALAPSQFACFSSEEERQVALRQAQAELTRREMEMERQRMRLPLERLNQCMELMERCGPMSEDEQRKFRQLISEQAANTSWMA